MGLKGAPGGRHRPFVGPEAEAALERAVVVAAANPGRQVFHEADIAPAKDDVLGRHGGAQHLGGLQHGRAPGLFTEPEQASLAADVLEGLIAIGQVREFQRHHAAFVHERRTQPGPEAEEQHAAPLVAAEGLHGGVVDDARGHTERGLEVEAHPAAPEVPGLLHHRTTKHGAGDADGGDVVVPIRGVDPHAGDQLRRGEARARVEPPGLGGSRGDQLHMAAADINDQDAHGGQHIEERARGAIERLAMADWRLIGDWGIE